MSLGGLSYGDVVEGEVQSLTLQASLEQSHHFLEASPLAVTPLERILRVNGVPGEGQDSEYGIFACEGTLEVPKKYSCHYLTKKELNKEVSLKKGLYALAYSVTGQFIEVKGKTLVNVDLDKIKINPQGQKYSLYLDLTNKKMQDLLIKDLYTNHYNKRFERLCASDRNRSPDTKTICKYVTSKNLNEFAKTIRFNEDGSVETLHYSYDDENLEISWRSRGRRPVNHTYDVEKKETFVSVFRGTYILQFTNDNGQTSDVYGVNSWED